MNEEIKEKAVILPPFKHFIMTVGAIPTSYLESMTYYEMLVWFTNYLGKTVIPAINENGEAVIELQNLFVELQDYVNNYFDNLDVQEEINNKLDDMAESGQLTDIIAQYLQLAGVLAFNTISDLESAENIVDGSICYCLGANDYLDGKGGFYKIRTVTTSDVIDNFNIISLNVSNTLIGERVTNDFIKYEDLDNSNISMKFKNIDIKTDYYLDTMIYEIIIDKSNDLKLVPISDDTTSPETNAKSIYNYSQNKNYDLCINAAVENLPSHIPVGSCIFDGVGYDGQYTPPYYVGFDENNNLMLIDKTNITDYNDLLDLGVTNGCGCFEPIINNSQNYNFSNEAVYTTKQPRQIIAQDSNGKIHIYSVMGRNTYNKGLTYTELQTYLSNKNIINAICLDGGGSTQTVYNKKSLFTSLDPTTNTGRAVSTSFVFNIEEE